MFKILPDGVMRLTRGDTAPFNVPIFIEEEGVPVEEWERYTMFPTDRLTLSVKRSTRDTEYALQVSAVGTNTLVILPADTRDLEPGTYKYDIQLERSPTDIRTLVDEPLKFILVEDVTI